MTSPDTVMKELASALEANTDWIGAPPTGMYEYDSQREDAWKVGKEALSKYRSYVDATKKIDGVGQCHDS